MTEVFAPRNAWPAEFPDVITHTTVKLRDHHHDYLNAKSGQHNSALALVYDLICPVAVNRLRGILFGHTPYLVPVGASKGRVTMPFQVPWLKS